jgi:hypothetical protein
VRGETCANESISDEPARIRGNKSLIRRLVARHWAEAVVVAVALLLWVPRLSGPLDLRWDGGVYYVLGTSLATGQGYRILSEPGSPEALQYPPLLPAVVALYQRVLGSTDPAIVGPWLRISYAALFLAYALTVLALAKRYLRPALALAAAALCLFHPWTIFLSDLLFAEIPFALISVLFVLAVVDGWFVSRPRLRETVSFALAAGGFLLRTAGIALLAAWVIEALARHRWRQMLTRGVLALLPIVAWQAYVTRVQGSYGYAHPAYEYQRASYQYYNVSYAENILLRDPFRPELGQLDVLSFASRVRENLTSLVAAIGESVSTRKGWWRRLLIESQRDTIGRFLIPIGFGSVLTFGLAIIVLAGLAILAWRGAWLMVFIVIGSIGLVWATPWPAQFTRYLTPLAPFFAICAVLPLSGIEVLLRAWQSRLVIPLARMAIGGILLLAFTAEIYTSLTLIRSRNASKESLVIPQGTSPGYPLFFHDSSWQTWEEAAAWIGAHAPPDAIVATTAPHFLYLRTGRRAVLPPMDQDPLRARRLLEAVPVSYVIVDELEFLDVSRRYALPAVKGDPLGWHLVHTILLPHSPPWIKPADSVNGTQIYQRITGSQ